MQYFKLKDHQATNQLLTSLDRLRYRHNVLVLCTSNLLTAIVSTPTSIVTNVVCSVAASPYSRIALTKNPHNHQEEQKRVAI